MNATLAKQSGAPTNQVSQSNKTLALYLLLAGVVGYLLVSPTYLAAQINQEVLLTNATQTPIEGVGHDYIHDMSETVNPQNGQVSIRIAGPSPHERGPNLPHYAYMYDTSGREAMTFYPVFEGCSLQNSGAGPTLCYTYIEGPATANYALNEFNPNALMYGVSGPNPTILNTIWTSPLPSKQSWQDPQIPGGVNEPTTYFCQYNAYSYFDSQGGLHNLNLHVISNASPPAGTIGTIADDCATLGYATDYFGGDSSFKAVCQVNSTCPSLYGATSAGMLIGVGGITGGIEDTNGNGVNGTGRPSSYTTVTVNGFSQPGWTTGGSQPSSYIGLSTITLPGVSGAYTYRYSTFPRSGTVGLSASVNSYSTAGGCLLPNLGSMTQSTRFSDVSSLILPNGQSYTFGYDSQWGLVNSITYPTGGKVTYTWDVNSLSESYNGATPDVWTSVTLNGGKKNCYFEYDLPVVKTRVVSFDGSHPALEQDFAYSTQPGTNGFWSSKTTTVTTTDLVRPANPKTVTIYNYIPMFPPLIATGTSAQSVVPHEDTVVYQDGSGNTLRTVKKVWLGVDLLGAECEILANGKVSGKFYRYQPSLTVWSVGTDQVTDLAEYDYTQGVTSACVQPPSTTAPARETKTQYATTPSSVLWQPSLSAAIPQTNDRPSVIQVYDHGTLIAETDIAYDQTSVKLVSPSAYNHDETNLSPSQVAGRGNATTITKKCIQNCSQNAVTTAQYDETGQIAAVTDPNGNATTLSYTDNYSTGGTPPGNTNTYVTTITRPATNGVNHISSFAYHYTFGELTSAIDENLQLSTYQYNDTWGRPTLGVAPDGGQTQKVYNDSAPSPTVTTCQLINGTAGATCLATSPPTGWKTTLATMDGVGQVVQNALVSDPDGPTYTATTYDGLGRKYMSTNPYRNTGDSTYGITAYTYDALGRTTVVQQPDGSMVQTAYDQLCIASANGDGTTVTDETGKLRESCSDGLGRLIEVDEPGAGATTAIAGSATVTIGGSEQTRLGSPGTGSATVVLSGSGCVYISQHGVYYAPSGSVSITVKGVNVGTGTVAWSGSCNQSNGALTINPTLSGIASDLASSLTGSGAGVIATSNGATIQIVANATGSGTNYPLSSSYSLSTGDPSGSPYVSATVPATLTGGGSTAVSDSGTVSITVDGFTATASFASGTTAQEIASSLTSSLNAGSPVEASVSGTAIRLTALDFGSGSDYTLTTSDTWNSTDFTAPSFTATPSGATLTGGVSGVLGNSPLVTLYTYDALNNLTCAVQKGTDTTAFSACASASANWRPRSFVYDSLSRLTSATNPESGTNTYAYDANGNVITRVEPKANTPGSTALTTSTYSYDALNRLLSKVHADPISANSYYGYDGTAIPSCPGPVPPSITSPTNLVNRRSAMCTNQSASSWSYDPMGRPLVEARTNTGPPIARLNVSYGYYKDGSLNTLTYPSGDFLTYTVGGAGRPLAATDSTHNYVTAATYAPHGALAGMTNGTEIVTKNTYNNRLQSVLLSAGVTGQNSIFSLCYDFHLQVAVSSTPCAFNANTTGDNGNVFQILNNVDSTRSTVFTYDSLNRLSQANTVNTTFSTNPNCWGEAYTIDPWGNLTNKGAPSGMSGNCTTEGLSATATTQNQLAGIGLVYDPAGNVVNDGLGNTPTYDAENRIVTVAGVNYYYDGDGVRINKSSGTMYWPGPSGTFTETTLAGTINEEYVYFNGERIARVDRPSGTANYYFSDMLGSASVIASPVGAVQEQYFYFPYGGTRSSSGSDPNHYKFTGKERDAESGLDMFGARYYGSSLGRFMTPDWAAKPTNVPYASFGNPQSLNLYSYVNNNPTTTRDPDGHVAGVDDLVIGGIIVSAMAVAYLESPPGQQMLRNAASSITSLGSSISSFFHPDNSGQNAAPPPTLPTNVSQGTPGTTATNVATGTPASTSQQGAVDASAMQQAGPNYAGNNIVQGSGRVNSDLPGGQAEAGQKFGELTAGQGTSVDAKTGHTVADDGTRLRNNADGTARIDRPASVTGGQHETVHFNQPKKPDQPNQ